MVTESHTWNSRLQQTGMQAGSLLTLAYTYCDGGARFCASGNTGSPWQQTISIGGQTVGVQAYQHDSLNRLLTVGESAGGWKRTYAYDMIGNAYVDSTSTNTFGYTTQPFTPTQPEQLCVSAGREWESVGDRRPCLCLRRRESASVRGTGTGCGSDVMRRAIIAVPLFLTFVVTIGFPQTQSPGTPSRIDRKSVV